MPSGSASQNLLTAQKLFKTKIKFKKEFTEFKKNSIWLIDHKEKMRESHGDMYVAIRNGEPCCQNENFAKLLAEVNKKYSNAQDVHIDFIGKVRMNLLL